MDASRFDRLAKQWATPRSRRDAFSLVAGALGGLVVSEAAGKRGRRSKRRRQGQVSAQGPCGDGGPKQNDCRRDGQCCTGYCRKQRCRCRKPGDTCREDRNCCPERTGATCQEGVCRLAGSGGECTPGQTRACYSGPAGTENRGECRGGLQTCAASGVWGACVGEVLPQPETCNARDDDCDGVIDNDALCPSVPHAIIACVAGACQNTCAPGFADCDGIAANGCETSLLTDPRNCGGCGRECGPCPNGTPAACAGGHCLCSVATGG